MSLRTTAEVAHAFAAAAAGTQTGGVGPFYLPIIVAAVAVKRVYVYRLILTISANAANVTLYDSAGTALSQGFQLAANGSITLDTPINFDPWWQTGIGLGLQIGMNNGTTLCAYDLYYLQGP